MTSAAASLGAAGAHAVLFGSHRHDPGSRLPDLPAVATTLDDLEVALRDVCGISADRVHRVPADAGTEEVLDAIERVADEATGVVLLYYVGHGLLGPGDELYMATYGTESPDQVSRAVSYHTLQGLLSRCAGGGIVVLDCCYSGRADVPDSNGSAAQTPFVSSRPDGSLLLSATSRYDLSFAPSGRRHTLFSGQLLRLLTEGDPTGPLWMTMDSLYAALDHAFEDGPIRPRRQSEGSLGALLVARNRAYRPSGDGADGDLRNEPPADIPCPYPGTESFRTADSPHFFGRDDLVRRLLDTVCRASSDGTGSMTVLTGASGVGKSSLIRAGLLAGLERRHLAAPDRNGLPWPALLLAAPGVRPLTALARLWGQATGRTTADVHRRLVETRRLPPPKPGRTPCRLLVVDQFEEVFTRCPDPEERARFIDVLTCAGDRSGPDTPGASTGTAAGAPVLHVVLGLRADHYGSCLAHPALVPVLERHQVTVAPMSDEGLRAAIEGPAGVVGLGLERGLTERLVQDLRWGNVPTGGADVPGTAVDRDRATASEPADPFDTAPDTDAATYALRAGPAGASPSASVPDLDTALPFLAHALRETWRRRSGTTLTLAGYQSTGGIWHSISTTTERLYLDLDPAGQEALRELMLRLVHVRAEGPDSLVRRKVAPEALLDGFPEEQRHLVAGLRDRLAEARLITVDQDGTQLSHESLLRAWPRLRRWIDEDRSGLILRQRLSEAAHAWEAADRDPGFLYRGSPLEAARALRDVERVRDRRLPSLDERFLEVSSEADRAERALEARRTLRLKQALGAVALALVLAVVGAAFAVQQQRVAKTERRTATHRALIAEATARRASEPRLALKLAMAAHRIRPTAETRAAVSDTLVQSRLVGSSDYPEDRPVLSPDGRLMAAEGGGEQLVLRDIGEKVGNARVAAFTPCDGAMGSTAFSHDGRTLAVTCGNGAVNLWDISRPAAPRPTGSLKPATVRGGPGAVGFSPDGKVLAVGWYPPEKEPQTQGSLVLWDISDHTRPAVLTVNENVYDSSAVLFGPDGRTLVSSTGIVSFRDEAVSSDSLVHTSGATLWDVSEPSSPRRLARIERVGEETAFSRDGKTLFTKTDQTVQAWDISTPATPRKLTSWTAHKEGVTTLDLGPDGRTLATASFDRTIALWDVSDPSHPVESARLTGHASMVEAVRFSTDGHQLFSADLDHIVQWDALGAGQPRPLAALDTKASLTSAAFTPDGQTLATAGYDEAVTLYDMTAPSRPTRTAAATMAGFVTDLAISSDGKLLAAGDRLGNVVVWDIGDRLHPSRLTGFSHSSDPITSVDFGRDGTVVVSGAKTLFSPGWATVWDIREPGRPREVGAIANNLNAAQPLHISADGKLLTLPGLSTFLWPADGSRQAIPLDDSNGSAAFAPDGKALATGGSGRGIIVWDIKDPGRPKKAAEVPSDGVSFSRYIYHPAGHLVAGLNRDDGTVTLWSVADQTRIHAAAILTGHSRSVSDLAFRPDGQYAVTVSGGDTPAVVWDLNRLPDISANPFKAACVAAEGGFTPEEWKKYVPGQPYADTCDGHMAGAP